MSRRTLALLALLALFAVVAMVSCRAAPGTVRDGVGVFIAGEQSTKIWLRADEGRLLKIEIPPSSGLPVAGDWDGDGRDTVGYFEPGEDAFHLSDDFGEGAPQFSRVLVGWDCPACLPVAGAFGGSGVDGVGLYDPSRGLFLLRDRPEASAPIRAVSFGAVGVSQWPLAGRFAPCREEQLGLYDPASATFHLRGCRPDDSARVLHFGVKGGFPIAGRWGGQEYDEVGVFDPAAGRFLLRAPAADAAGEFVVQFLRAPAMPIAGQWSFASH